MYDVCGNLNYLCSSLSMFVTNDSCSVSKYLLVVLEFHLHVCVALLDIITSFGNRPFITVS